MAIPQFAARERYQRQSGSLDLQFCLFSRCVQAYLRNFHNSAQSLPRQAASHTEVEMVLQNHFDKRTLESIQNRTCCIPPSPCRLAGALGRTRRGLHLRHNHHLHMSHDLFHDQILYHHEVDHFHETDAIYLVQGRRKGLLYESQSCRSCLRMGDDGSCFQFRR